MAILTEARRRFQTTAAILGGVAFLAAVYLVVPVGAGKAERYVELNAKQAEVHTQQEQVKPLLALPQLLVKSKSDIAEFYKERLPARFSVVPEQIGKLALDNGVALADVKYDVIDTDIPSLQLVQIDASLSGDYAKIAKFINAVERNKIFFLVDGITLADQKGTGVKLELKIETYLRPRTTEEFKAEEKPDNNDKNHKGAD